MNETKKHIGNYPCNDDNRLIRQQAMRLMVTLVSLGGSIWLYYLGFFGTVEGPLNPEKIGAAMAGKNIAPGHLLAGLFLIFLVSISWNWVYNLIHRIKIERAASRHPQAAGKQKNEPVTFQPVRKGPWSHTIWAGALMGLIGFCVQLI
ncbi:hypothetical protein [Desulfotignum phosphitoxidans]|uniref:Uncharacterized protein n=1 Tax=Desulfotignum phosphitoxidans DSM 13687 TaxID=1286635 RepID=S0G050_9BACT|nr:hypothetical protein [Desulfotignum phosphitoxidans]EMS80738.1 hypothetical protein Dpo_2c04340 [Desulfotignum phosphitoxidans DSM 13687]